MAYNHHHDDQWPPLRREEKNVVRDIKQTSRRQVIHYEHTKQLSPPPPSKPQHVHRPQRAKTVKPKWAVGGPGTQAIFLKTSPNPSPRPTGTGVFIPRRDGAKQFNEKPAFASVLLPARVVQVLNLNVHELANRITKPKPADDRPTKKVDEEKKTEKDDENYLSPELCLPEEWVYE